MRPSSVIDQMGIHAVYRLDVLGGDDILRGADREDLPVPHHYDIVGVLRSDVDVVTDHHDHDPPEDGLLLKQADDIHLVLDVQIGRRFVEEQHLRLLRQSASEHHPLMLSGGQFVERTHRQVGDVHHLQCLLDDLHVVVQGVPFPVGVPPHEDGVHDGHREAVSRCVRDVADLLRQLLRPVSGHVPLIDQHRPLGR